MRDTVTAHATAGLLGGAVGTALMQASMKASGKLPESFRPPAVREDPARFMTTKMEQLLLGGPLPHGLRVAIERSMPWGYGMTSGLLLGVATSRRHLGSLRAAALAGAAMGAAVWAIGYLGWMPAAKLIAPVTRQGPRHVATSVLGHVAFGLAAAAPIFLLDRRASWWERLRARMR